MIVKCGTCKKVLIIENSETIWDIIPMKCGNIACTAPQRVHIEITKESDLNHLEMRVNYETR